ncbi:hypothetical protein COCNU_06G015420 [Cocos nucifera]|uniref:Uncharacterized protein n=1 Tax=Cocos nucifera TaxID=13894 RepID=A0A8K0ICD0_COCNU|nr:hypothetical protein COCNU_06G015420 [Cocos nucifera]
MKEGPPAKNGLEEEDKKEKRMGKKGRRRDGLLARREVEEATQKGEGRQLMGGLEEKENEKKKWMKKNRGGRGMDGGGKSRYEGKEMEKKEMIKKGRGNDELSVRGSRCGGGRRRGVRVMGGLEERRYRGILYLD